ncbi:hypothetical protein AL072_29920 [Azospirillum thiophilum]|uniref:HNH nuclease domain-containing protein n=1 Tax=Azospirillum thiophilum TaxID=528244 RepID=A0AAC8ZW70_9PROT|nr:hypothetical protein AL072_29920 [Azospirillum thiophilum]
MPWKPKKPCARPGCGRLTDGRFCDAHAAEDRQRHDRARQDAQPWRGWYKVKSWLDIRAWRLSVEPLCRMCSEHGLTVAATVVDHVKPHRGDRALFFNRENTQSLCKPCHDGPKQAAERAAARAGQPVPGRSARGVGGV